MNMLDVVMENIAGRNRNRFYHMLINGTGSGPFDGGCVVVAQAIQAKHGGDIVVLTGQYQPNTKAVAQHAAVKLGDLLIDFDGAAPVQDFVQRFQRTEMAHSGGVITGIRPIQDQDLPDAPRNTELAQKLARLIR